ncbi:MAG: hypothetical protein LBD97_03325, partial [Bifidobacteriaceae bacterium]|nr:hypothetical protein [Bifidobacteriaceae bacterium]
QPEAPQPGPPGPEPADAESAGPEWPGPERPEPEAAGDEDQDRQPPKWKRWLRRGAGGPGTASDPAE